MAVTIAFGGTNTKKKFEEYAILENIMDKFGFSTLFLIAEIFSSFLELR